MRYFEISNINYTLDLWGPETFVTAMTDLKFKRLLAASAGDVDDIDWCRHLNATYADGFCHVQAEEVGAEEAELRLAEEGRPVFLHDIHNHCWKARANSQRANLRSGETMYVFGHGA